MHSGLVKDVLAAGATHNDQKQLVFHKTAVGFRQGRPEYLTGRTESFDVPDRAAHLAPARRNAGVVGTRTVVGTRARDRRRPPHFRRNASTGLAGSVLRCCVAHRARGLTWI